MPGKPKFGKGKTKKGHGPGKRQPQAAKPIVSASGKEVKGIVRLAGRDLRGSFPLKRAVTSVKGIGINLGGVISKIACEQLGIDEKTMVGELSEEQIAKLEGILQNPDKYGIPSWMFNRQNDIMTGQSKHFIGADLVFSVRQDIDHEKDAYTWRGYRHQYGQKVRGQRTRSTGRTGMTVGVLRKAVLEKAKEIKAEEKGGKGRAAPEAAPAAASGEKPAPEKKAAAPAPKPAEKKPEPKK